MRRFLVRVNGETYEVEVMEITADGKKEFAVSGVQRLGATRSSEGLLRVTTTVRAPMPGRIVAVNVKKGDEVQAGQVAIILEAMKMENEIPIEHSGIVTQVYVEENDTVDVGDPLFEIEEVRS
ncbi:biotin/lipoyl-containing protein [Candidatus Caldatribacterium sp.]|uniref:biotin/lipoyl-containing protein n=1 Tax=Candidatus Caldatribacterium sp. TaxID=2282143 RepID=UPI00299BABDD|nr:biotin/lipoyl-binding protein [Candidatus Caldatribacterium sp.]MDW8081725.1 biotin/lipoyl-containing protein [Candidatus Calescibacterium sp.]